MESLKKILPYILIAIIFAIGGYFIGKGSLNNQCAALYNAVDGRVYLPKIKTLDNPKSIVKDGVTVVSNVTEQQCKGLGGTPFYNYNNNPATYWGCFVPALSLLGNASLNAAYFSKSTSQDALPAIKVQNAPVPTLSETDCKALGGTVVCSSEGDYVGCMLPPTFTGVPGSTVVKPTTTAPTSPATMTR